jgi:hypothetical protein
LLSFFSIKRIRDWGWGEIFLEGVEEVEEVEGLEGEEIITLNS